VLPGRSYCKKVHWRAPAFALNFSFNRVLSATEKCAVVLDTISFNDEAHFGNVASTGPFSDSGTNFVMAGKKMTFPVSRFSLPTQWAMKDFL